MQWAIGFFNKKETLFRLQADAAIRVGLVFVS
jgi:hypothetical protein